jgi:DNA-binding NtrC family response regulator
MTPEFIAALMRSDWPGNVRQLQNYVERVLAMTPGAVLCPDPPPPDLDAPRAPSPRAAGGNLKRALEDVERRLIEEALAASGGNQSLAARKLGVPEQTLRYRLARRGLSTRKNPRVRNKS